MKHPLILFILFISVSNFSNAQSFDAGMSFGIVASQVDGDNLSGYDKFGLYGGVFVSLPLNDKVEIAMQISFIQKGSRKNAKPYDGIYNSYLMRLNYAEIPLYFNWKLYQEKLFFMSGLSLGYLINAIEKDEYGIIDQPASIPEFRKFEFGILGGFSYKINEKWSAGLRAQYSIIPIRKTPLSSLVYFNEAQNNNLLTTSLSYLF